jgi:hypothetical protein
MTHTTAPNSNNNKKRKQEVQEIQFIKNQQVVFLVLLVFPLNTRRYPKKLFAPSRGPPCAVAPVISVLSVISVQQDALLRAFARGIVLPSGQKKSRGLREPVAFIVYK